MVRPFDRVPRGIRFRTTLTTTLVTGVMLVLGALVLMFVLGNKLRDNLDATIENQAADRAQLLDAGADPQSLVSTRQAESLVWIGTPNGEVIALGGNYRIVGPPPDLTIGGGRTVNLVLEEQQENGLAELEETEVTLAVAQASDGTLVAVGSELETVTKTTNEVRNLLAIGLPFLLALVAMVSYRATGRTLAPVAEIRGTAEAIGAGPIDRRVPVPGTDDEVQRLAITVNDMLDRLDAQRQAQRRFTADASHELKSPVANMRAVVETADIDSPQWSETRTRLVAESERLAAIVDNLLFMAVSDETEGVPAFTETVHVDDILFDEAELLAARGKVRVDINGVQPCETIGDADQLRRMLRNLIQNAERYASSTVAVSCHEHTGDPSNEAVHGEILIAVSDDGPGVPLEQREKIFERFGRAESARDRRSGGTGLGLAIARAIAERHMGAIAVSQADNGGACFTVRLSPP